jgi:hypothetical protein
MRFAAAIFFALMLCAVTPAHADIDQVQAREVARNNNCTPSKVDVYQQSLGSEGTTVYKIDCTVPKTADANAPKEASSLLVSCKDNLCEMVRPLAADAK